MNRSTAICRGALTLLLLVSLLPAAARGDGEPAGEVTDDALERARQLLAETPLVDTHNDLPWVIREKLDGDVEGYDISVRARWDTDIPRLREGGVGVQFWSVYVPSSLEPFEAMRAQLEQIDIARRMIATYEDLGWAESVADIARELEAGRIASLLGIEGGHTIGNSLGALRAYYDLGVRYMTLTHFNSNDWADSATGEKRHGGLSEFGREVVREMNRLGMMVDLSHVSAEAMADALDTSEAPVIFSHSSARALTAHVRNVPDEILERLADNGGVVMVTFIPSFVSEEVRHWEGDLMPKLAEASTDEEWRRIVEAHVAEKGPAPRATISAVADHVEHVARVAGIEHVGIGGDYYGAESESELVEGLEDVSKYPYLFAELVERGWSEDDLRKLAAENVLRVLAEVEAVAARLRAARPPSLLRLEE
ncbi:MAG: dipeptidase [Thermoanaerobaculia bacterium]|nr:dipeptidase [Thermoanaerobaculia bacterium]